MKTRMKCSAEVQWVIFINIGLLLRAPPDAICNKTSKQLITASFEIFHYRGTVDFSDAHVHSAPF